MAFMDDFANQQDDKKAGREALKVRMEAAQAALGPVIEEMVSVFGPDPKVGGIQVERVSIPVQNEGGNFQFPGLKVTFPSRQMVMVKAKGMAFGGFLVDILFTGCQSNAPHQLIHLSVSQGSDERAWCFLRNNGGGPEATRWSRDEFEAILSMQVLGKPRAAK